MRVKGRMKKIQTILICFLIICCCGPAQAAVQTRPMADAQITPETWLVRKGRELLNILSVRQAKERYLKLRRLCKEVFNQKEMPRLARGKYWKNMTSAQQEELQRLFFDYFVVTYGSAGFSFSNVSIHVTETIPSGKDLLLKTKIKIERENHSFSGQPDLASSQESDPALPSGSKASFSLDKLDKDSIFEMLFALRKKGQEYYIRDAKVEGQSMIMFLRSFLEREFADASFDGEKFLDGVRKKINERYRAAEELAKIENGKRL